MERRLAAILAADVAGYSRLMEKDEESILTRQKGHRRELIDPEIGNHGGRIVKTTGDGMLVESRSARSSPSVSDASTSRWRRGVLTRPSLPEALDAAFKLTP